MTLKIGILISGRGSNMQAILEAIKQKELPAVCKIVVSNIPTAKGLEIAKSYQVPALAVDPKTFPNITEYEKEVLKILRKNQVELVILAGYMKILGPTLLEAFPNKIINIHPSLLPSFKGLNAQKQALDFGVKVAGCTVHFVTNELDNGPIILQETVPVLENDTEKTLSARILEKEHLIYPKAIKLYAQGKLEINGSKVKNTK